MADFCRQCSIDTFGEDSRDLAGITPKHVWDEQGIACRVLCEGCGSILVDPDGNCCSGHTCIEGHPYDPEGNSEDNVKEDEDGKDR